VKRCIVALFIAFVAVPSAALAMPPENVRRHWSPPPSVQPGTDEGTYLPSQLPAKGTDVAALDQQAPVFSSTPASEPADSGFDWSDAGVGALAGTTLAAFAIAGAVGLRRRRAAPLTG
jgi:hypothetical protein